MKGHALVALAAVLGLTACSGATGPRAASAGRDTGAPVVPVSCGQQYRSWTSGEGKGLMSAFDAVSSAATAGDRQALHRALRHAGPAVARAAHHPIPACADPRGYWSVLLMHVNAAVTGKDSARSVREAMRDVPKIHGQLKVEVEQTAQ